MKQKEYQRDQKHIHPMRRIHEMRAIRLFGFCRPNLHYWNRQILQVVVHNPYLRLGSNIQISMFVGQFDRHHYHPTYMY